MRLAIDELVVRVPGLSPDEARALGEQVARRVAMLLAEQPSVRTDLGALDLHLQLPRSTAVADLVDPIADAILARLA